MVQNIMAVLGLLLGGVIVLPVAAWLVSRVNPFLLGGVVGTSLVVLNVQKLIPGINFMELLFSGLGVWRSRQREPEADVVLVHV